MWGQSGPIGVQSCAKQGTLKRLNSRLCLTPLEHFLFELHYMAQQLIVLSDKDGLRIHNKINFSCVNHVGSQCSIKLRSHLEQLSDSLCVLVCF